MESTMPSYFHSILNRLPEVASFSQSGEDAGGWGATIVAHLRIISKIAAS